jgi:hypothetical protein
MIERISKIAGGPLAAAVVASVLTLGFVYAGTRALASHDGSTIHGCVKNSNGQLRVVSDPGDCNPSETSLDWSQGFELTTTKRTVAGSVAGGMPGSVEASCEAGEVVTGGGYDIGSIGFDDKVITNGPLDEDTWVVGVFNNTAFEIDVFVSIVCAQTDA